MDAMCHVCWTMVDTVNVSKLQAFHQLLRNSRLTYITGTLQLLCGGVPHHQRGLPFAGIPFRMGKRPSALLATVRSASREHAAHHPAPPPDMCTGTVNKKQKKELNK